MRSVKRQCVGIVESDVAVPSREAAAKELLRGKLETA